jgi:hypothetical protein
VLGKPLRNEPGDGVISSTQVYGLRMGIYYPQETTLAPLAETTDAGELEHHKLEERQRTTQAAREEAITREKYLSTSPSGW